MKSLWRGIALIIFVIYPLVELFVAIWIASMIGWMWVILISCIGFVAGITLLRRNVVSGLLIAVPGFVTDIIGLVLLITPIRKVIGAGIVAGIAHRVGIPRGLPWPTSQPATEGYLPPDPDHPVVQGEVIDPDDGPGSR
jgi:UPF0716 family protein affecting phage T7 exclusion